jgi:hypothetical protein
MQKALEVGALGIAKHVPWLLHLLQQPLLNLVPFSIFCPSFFYGGCKKARILNKITFILWWTKQLSSFTCCNNLSRNFSCNGSKRSVSLVVSLRTNKETQ